MNNTITLFRIIFSVMLVGSIILQTRGSQTGIAFGGGGETYRSKRGIEKFLFYTTIIVTVLFAASSILSLVL